MNFKEVDSTMRSYFITNAPPVQYFSSHQNMVGHFNCNHLILMTGNSQLTRVAFVMKQFFFFIPYSKVVLMSSFTHFNKECIIFVFNDDFSRSHETCVGDQFLLIAIDRSCDSNNLLSDLNLLSGKNKMQIFSYFLKQCLPVFFQIC